MNIIVIVCDTLRRDFLACYGNDWVHTPNIAALADEALVFDRAYAGSFPTIGHRIDLMTGRYAFTRAKARPIDAGETSVQAALQQQGYVTQLISDHVQLMLPGLNFHMGFDGYQWVRGHQADRFTTDHDPVEWPCAPEKLREPEKLVIPHMKACKGRRFEREWHDPATVGLALDWLEHNYRQERFYLCLDLFGTHEPWDPPQHYRDLYDPGYDGEEVILPRYDFKSYLTEREIRHVRALYAGMITMTDRWLGRLFESLKLMGLWDRTAILLTSDHGWYHGEHGRMGKHTVLDRTHDWPLYEEVNHIPLVLRVPGLADSGRRDALVQPVDLAPTLMELAGAPLPANLDGASLMPLVRGEARAVRDLAVTSLTLRPDPELRTYITVTDGEWTLIDGGRAAQCELYHLPDDPGQANDLLDAQPEKARELHDRCVAFLREADAAEERIALRAWPDGTHWQG